MAFIDQNININAITAANPKMKIWLNSDFKKTILDNASVEAARKYADLCIESNQKLYDDKITLDQHRFMDNEGFCNCVIYGRNNNGMSAVMDENQVQKFIRIISDDRVFLNEHSIKKMYGFYRLNEIWFLTDRFNVEALDSFDSAIFRYAKKVNIDVITLLVGIHEVDSESLPEYDCEKEVG